MNHSRPILPYLLCSFSDLSHILYPNTLLFLFSLLFCCSSTGMCRRRHSLVLFFFFSYLPIFTLGALLDCFTWKIPCFCILIGSGMDPAYRCGGVSGVLGVT